MTLMQRRRALMAAKDGKSVPVYQIKNQTVTAGTKIDTGVKVMVADYASTIMLDFTNTGNPTSGIASIWKAIEMWSATINAESLCIGKAYANDTLQKIAWYAHAVHGLSITGSSTAPARHRYCITHDANSKTATLYYKRNNDTVQTVTVTTTNFVTTQASVKFGANANDQTSLPAGTVNNAKIYNRVLSQSEIDAFFA